MDIIAIPTEGNGGLKDKVNPKFGKSKIFTIINIEKGEIVEVKAIYNPAFNSEGSFGTLTSQFLSNQKVNIIITDLIGPNAFTVLNDSYIKIFQTPSRELSIKEVINLFLKNKLPEIKKPNVMSHLHKE